MAWERLPIGDISTAIATCVAGGDQGFQSVKQAVRVLAPQLAKDIDNIQPSVFARFQASAASDGLESLQNRGAHVQVQALLLQTKPCQRKCPTGGCQYVILGHTRDSLDEVALMLLAMALIAEIPDQDPDQAHVSGLAADYEAPDDHEADRAPEQPSHQPGDSLPDRALDVIYISDNDEPDDEPIIISVSQGHGHRDVTAKRGNRGNPNVTANHRHRIVHQTRDHWGSSDGKCSPDPGLPFGGKENTNTQNTDAGPKLQQARKRASALSLDEGGDSTPLSKATRGAVIASPAQVRIQTHGTHGKPPDTDSHTDQQAAASAELAVLAKYADRYGNYSVPVAPGSMVELRETQTEAGRGVFAVAPLKNGTIVTSYHGEKISLERMRQAREAKDPRVFYTVDVGPKRKPLFYVLGHLDPVEGEGLGAFVNDPRGSSRGPNCMFRTVGDLQDVYIQVVRDIAAGEQLTVDYGRDYWREWSEVHQKRAPETDDEDDFDDEDYLPGRE